MDLILNKIVQFEDIDLVHVYNSSTFYVCPKGNNHLLYILNGTINRMIPDKFNTKKYWELKCIYQPEFNQIYVAYLNNDDNEKQLYQFNIDEAQFTLSSYKFYYGIYDFKWTSTKDSRGNYPIFIFYKQSNSIYLKLFDIKISQNKFDVSEVRDNLVFTGLKRNNYLFFNSENGYFYYINYNNIYDFETGYSEEYSQIDETNYKIVKAIVNKVSPFEFVDDVVLEEVKFITYTKYAYYKLYNNNKNIYYYGILDVTLNKVIFNTDEEISQFIPYSKNSMLVMTPKNFYKICSIYDDKNQNSFNCLDKCPDGTHLILDTDNKNVCKTSYNCPAYNLIPNDICVKDCDANIFMSNDTDKTCGLCKDINEENPYKIINSSNCIDSIIDGTEYYNENLKILKCSKGYFFENDTCNSKNCYPNCEDCSESSQSETDQKCLNCNEGFKLLEGNCINECPEKFYENNKECFKCKDSCKSCSNANTCTTCDKGLYINNGECLKCHENCETCSDGIINGNEHCTTCKYNDTYLIDVSGLNRNCVKECPKNTTLDITKKKCVKSEENDDSDSISLKKVILLIAIVLLAIIIIGIIIYCIRRAVRRKKAGILIMDDIKKDMPIME